MIERLTNVGILLIGVNFLWAPLTGMVETPFNWLSFIFALGVACMVRDIADYHRSPTWKSISHGLLLGPFWILLRPLVMPKN